ncbi:uncharacterized protein TNCV_4360861 [Trichonephila clavipes]|nr:uncharacterized protein TNCV_4360861 [Trichonephila clavipes]
MSPHSITPVVRDVCRCKAKAGLRHSPWGLHTRTRLPSLLRLKLDSSVKACWFHSTAVQCLCVRHHSKRKRRGVGVKDSTRNGLHDPKCPSVRSLRMVREATRASSEGATCAWIVADEAVVSTRAFLTKWWFSERLVY